MQVGGVSKQLGGARLLGEAALRGTRPLKVLMCWNCVMRENARTAVNNSSDTSLQRYVKCSSLFLTFLDLT